MQLETELAVSAPEVAQRLLGAHLIRDIDGQQFIVKIVETEAYDQTDAASHSYKGRTPRTDVMFGPAGHLYVYFTYGMHYCCNVVCGKTGEGAAVLIRAVEPIIGVDTMRQYRQGRGAHDLTNGPAKLCQALRIDKAMNGHDLSQAPLQLVLQQQLPNTAIAATPRIGISQATNVPWRFYIKGNDYVSRKS